MAQANNNQADQNLQRLIDARLDFLNGLEGLPPEEIRVIIREAELAIRNNWQRQQQQQRTPLSLEIERQAKEYFEKQQTAYRKVVWELILSSDYSSTVDSNKRAPSDGYEGIGNFMRQNNIAHVSVLCKSELFKEFRRRALKVMQQRRRQASLTKIKQQERDKEAFEKDKAQNIQITRNRVAGQMKQANTISIKQTQNANDIAFAAGHNAQYAIDPLSIEDTRKKLKKYFYNIKNDARHLTQEEVFQELKKMSKLVSKAAETEIKNRVAYHKAKNVHVDEQEKDFQTFEGYKQNKFLPTKKGEWKNPCGATERYLRRIRRYYTNEAKYNLSNELIDLFILSFKAAEELEKTGNPMYRDFAVSYLLIAGKGPQRSYNQLKGKMDVDDGKPDTTACVRGSFGFIAQMMLNPHKAIDYRMMVDPLATLLNKWHQYKKKALLEKWWKDMQIPDILESRELYEAVSFYYTEKSDFYLENNPQKRRLTHDEVKVQKDNAFKVMKKHYPQDGKAPFIIALAYALQEQESKGFYNENNQKILEKLLQEQKQLFQVCMKQVKELGNNAFGIGGRTEMYINSFKEKMAYKWDEKLESPMRRALDFTSELVSTGGLVLFKMKCVQGDNKEYDEYLYLLRNKKEQPAPVNARLHDSAQQQQLLPQQRLVQQQVAEQRAAQAAAQQQQQFELELNAFVQQANTVDSDTLIVCGTAARELLNRYGLESNVAQKSPGQILLQAFESASTHRQAMIPLVRIRTLVPQVQLALQTYNNVRKRMVNGR